MRFITAISTLLLASPALATLPYTFALMAFSNGQQIGCINGYGKFTQNLQWCYPMHAVPITGTDTTRLTGYDRCSVNTGTLECYPYSGVDAIVHQTGVNLATEEFGEAWSIAALPADPKDRVGVSLIAGPSGAIPVVLYVKAQSG